MTLAIMLYLERKKKNLCLSHFPKGENNIFGTMHLNNISAQMIKK